MSATHKQFGKYSVVAKIGQGGMGQVFKAWDPHLQRFVALKILLSNNDGNNTHIERFLKEAQASARLLHPNIVRVYDLGQENNVYFFTMDYIEGHSLLKAIKTKKYSLRKKVLLLETIARAVHFAHNNGVIHRDLKPSNIMLNGEGTPYVMDFGLAKITNVKSKRLTQSGSIIGTPYYMSPEQAHGDTKAINCSSDVYSLGIILYEMLTDRVPFFGKSAIEVLLKVIEKDPVVPSKINSRVPKSLEAICLKAMAKKKENRYLSAQDLADDLQRFSRGERVLALNRSYFRPVILSLVAVVFLATTIYLCYPRDTTTQLPPTKKGPYAKMVDVIRDYKKVTFNEWYAAITTLKKVLQFINVQQQLDANFSAKNYQKDIVFLCSFIGKHAAQATANPLRLQEVINELLPLWKGKALSLDLCISLHKKLDEVWSKKPFSYDAKVSIAKFSISCEKEIVLRQVENYIPQVPLTTKKYKQIYNYLFKNVHLKKHTPNAYHFVKKVSTTLPIQYLAQNVLAHKQTQAKKLWINTSNLSYEWFTKQPKNTRWRGTWIFFVKFLHPEYPLHNIRDIENLFQEKPHVDDYLFAASLVAYVQQHFSKRDNHIVQAAAFAPLTMRSTNLAINLQGKIKNYFSYSKRFLGQEYPQKGHPWRMSDAAWIPNEQMWKQWTVIAANPHQWINTPQLVKSYQRWLQFNIFWYDRANLVFYRTIEGKMLAQQQANFEEVRTRIQKYYKANKRVEKYLQKQYGK
ncbi:serine/threonine protein kinase [Candidatus Uabimicrobium amorphum]|uniref:non-specific serine/threonine protein kinase n=1 Tax=Uabimicrobium amorphum TaxID=2596890 RepID=A0A5S9F3I2_UABAM|nr:serine/threonine-protein kinase [Candidatus Uabimicrobium amorphum]BBM83464.1 protein kinase [Candidatus Uabimicrobium amorphum]